MDDTRRVNPWLVIHTRYASAIKSGQWDKWEERHWLDNEFSKLVPCGSCGSKWLSLSATIDLSNAESAFRSTWEAHNIVSTEHVLPPLPTMTYKHCCELWMGPRVAFISVDYAAHGGTETFHRTLIPALRHLRNIVGFGAVHGGGDGAALKVPYFQGAQQIRQLCAQADIVVTWGISDLAKLLPEKRPKVISVHHSDWSNAWNNNLILDQLTSIDEIVCVNRVVADELRTATSRPTYFISNAVDPARLIPSRRVDTEGKKIVLFGHRMSEEKRPQLAVEVARCLPPDWLLIMAGDGQSMPVDVPANVRVVGRLPTLADWLAVADCFLSLSTFDGFGLAMAEALKAGVPIVATPVGIAPDVAAVVLPTATTADVWAAAIVSVVSKGKRNKAAEFGIEEHVAKWASVLKF